MAHHEFLPAVAMAQLRNPRGGVARDLARRGRNVKTRMQVLVGKTSGDLARDIHVQPLRGQLAPGVEVGSDLPQAIHHYRGHGEIRPRRARALRFRPKGTGRIVFAMRVRAVAGNPYLTDALRAARL